MSGATPMTDDDIRAFGPSPDAGRSGPESGPARHDGRSSDRPRRRRVWPWVLLAAVALFVLVLLAILALAIPLAAGLTELARELNSGWVVTVDGRRIVLPELGEGQWLLVALALVLALAVIGLVLPMVVGAGLVGATLALGLTLLAALALLAVALAPLWLAAWLLWRGRRRPRAPEAAGESGAPGV